MIDPKQALYNVAPYAAYEFVRGSRNPQRYIENYALMLLSDSLNRYWPMPGMSGLLYPAAVKVGANVLMGRSVNVVDAGLFSASAYVGEMLSQQE